MFPVGMAALDQGYYGAAPSYWKAKELEDTNAAYNILGQTFQQMAGGGQQPAGWGGQSVIPGQMLTPPQAPPGGPPGAPGGMPRPGMMPTTPQGTLGSIIPSPAAGAAGIPQPGGMPPAQQPSPGPTGPPPGPPGAGPGPSAPGGPGGPRPGMMPGMAQPTPQPPAAVTQALGPAPYDWRTIAATIAQANPNASPAVIARAVTMMLPFMQADSQQQWHQINAYLSQERVDESRRSHEASEAGRAAGREETERYHREAEEDRQTRLRQSERRMENTEAWRTQDAARKDAMAASTQDKQDFDRKMAIWKQKYTIFDRNERARINAATNLNGKEKQEELQRLDAQRGAAERDMEEFSSQLPAKREVPGLKSSGTPRVNEGFNAAGIGKVQPVNPQQQADFKKLIESGQYTQDQIIQYLQQKNLDSSWLAR